jgi:hypothetical protein
MIGLGFQPLHPNGFAGASKCLQRKDWRFLLRKITLLAVICGVFFLASLAQAQQADAMVGFGTIMSSGTATCVVSFTSNCVGSEKGGLYTNLGFDVIFHKRLGFGFDAAWRTKQGLDLANGGQYFRPILFDFNGVYQPRISKKVGADIVGGIGWQTTRFYAYNNSSNCVFFGSCYTSNNHFLVDVGAGLRYYAYGHLFIRPEVHVYHILNNTDVFTNNNVVRVGASIGYTIGPD